MFLNSGLFSSERVVLTYPSLFSVTIELNKFITPFFRAFFCLDFLLISNIFLSISFIPYHLLLQGNIPDINIAEAESEEPQSGENQEPAAGDSGGSAGKIS